MENALPISQHQAVYSKGPTKHIERLNNILRQRLAKHPKAGLWPSEMVTLEVLHAIKGVGDRAFYRWLTRDYQPLFPYLPERTRRFRQFKTRQQWTLLFLAPPTLLGVVDSYGTDLIHPVR